MRLRKEPSEAERWRWMSHHGDTVPLGCGLGAGMAELTAGGDQEVSGIAG